MRWLTAFTFNFSCLFFMFFDAGCVQRSRIRILANFKAITFWLHIDIHQFNHLSTLYVLLFTPTPFMVNDFHCFGRIGFFWMIPSSVNSSPPKPNSTLCNIPPAPVAKYEKFEIATSDKAPKGAC